MTTSTFKRLTIRELKEVLSQIPNDKLDVVVWIEAAGAGVPVEQVSFEISSGALTEWVDDTGVINRMPATLPEERLVIR
jgi:hypothetical protein